MKPLSLSLFVLQFLLLFGCSNGQVSVVSIKSPVDGLMISIKKYQNVGVLVPNVTDVYLTFERNGESDKKLVLHGTYLTIARIDWQNANTATICLESGYTSQFYNNVTLNLYSQVVSHDVHFSLREDCK